MKLAGAQHSPADRGCKDSRSLMVQHRIIRFGEHQAFSGCSQFLVSSLLGGSSPVGVSYFSMAAHADTGVSAVITVLVRRYTTKEKRLTCASDKRSMLVSGSL